MDESKAAWVADKLVEDDRLEIVDRVGDNFLIVKGTKGIAFPVAVLGLKTPIQPLHVNPLFKGAIKPKLVINVPTKTLWSGSAIDFVHGQGAAFGALGDVARAAMRDDPGSFRSKNMDFFISSMRQHGNVAHVSYIFDCMFRVRRRVGSDVSVAVIDAYNMSAEDVRNARSRLGQFDVVVKSTSYGSITDQADSAAKTIGARALMFGELMAWLGK